MDQPSEIRLFSELKQDAENLSRLETFLSREFYLWRDRVRRALEDVFGHDSEEAREFLRIPFELDLNLLDAAEPTLRTIVQGLDPAASSIDFSVNQQRVYQQGLAQAGELILRIILDLEQPLS